MRLPVSLVGFVCTFVLMLPFKESNKSSTPTYRYTGTVQLLEPLPDGHYLANVGGVITKLKAKAPTQIQLQGVVLNDGFKASLAK